MKNQNNGEDCPRKPVSNFINVFKCCNRTVLITLLIYSERKFWNFYLRGKFPRRNDFPKKLCQPCFRKVTGIIEFQHLAH